MTTIGREPKRSTLLEKVSLGTDSVSDIATSEVVGSLRSQMALPAQTADLA
jgi:hypothetical protein